MKKVTVSAVVPADPKVPGSKEKTASISVNYAEKVAEAVSMYGEEAVLSNAFANWRVTLQANIRGALKRGEAPEAIAARLAGAKMGVAQTGGKVDPEQAYLAMFASATPEKQAQMLADLKKKAAAK